MIGSSRPMNSPTKTVDIGISPRKATSSTRVIESLHRELDELKLEMLNYKNRNAELKKANEIVTRRRDQLVEQLSNSKHENDTVNSLLQRKERRIASLEEQLNEATCSSDDLKFKMKSLETRCSKLQENEALSVAEYERIKIAYDIMVTSQKEYRVYYTSEIKSLKGKLEAYIKEKDTQMQKNITLINKSDATIYRSIKSIKLRSREIEEKYTKRDQELSRNVEQLQKNVDLNTQNTQLLIDTSRKLFDDVAEVMKIGKVALSYTNLSEGEHLVNSYVTDEPLENKLEGESKVVVRKGDQRHDESGVRTVSAEQRVLSLSKELNSFIPASDRTPTRLTTKSKPIFKNELLGELSGDSRKSSKQLDEDEAFGSTTTTKPSEPHAQIELSPEPQGQEVPTSSEGSKKRRRRKKRRAKKASATNDTGEPSGNESS
jgi:SWI5-dependent HO expression protein 3